MRMIDPDKFFGMHGKETVADVFNTLNEKQKTAVYTIIGEALGRMDDRKEKNMASKITRGGCEMNRNTTKQTVRPEDLQDCMLITKNGVKMRVAIDGFQSPPAISEDRVTFFEGRVLSVPREGSHHPWYTIKNVIFNDPATIVFWQDGTKTVVKCQDGDKFDPEKGLAMAIAKKVYGNQGNYCNQLKKWLPKEEKTKDIPIHVDPFSFSDLSNLIAEKMHEVFNGIKQSKEPQKKRMTFREEMAKLDPEQIDDHFTGGVLGCPRDQAERPVYAPCPFPGEPCDKKCADCWDREIPEELMRDDI